MQRSFKSRLEALERREVAREEVSRFVPPPPPTFDEVLARFDLVLAALGDGRAHVGSSGFAGEQQFYGLWGMPDPDVCAAGIWVDGVRHGLGLVFTTVEDYTAWIEADRRPLAFLWSRSDAELEDLIALDDRDPLFYTVVQRALADAWARLVEQ